MGKLRLRSDEVKVPTDSRALGISRRGSKGGTHSQAVKACQYLSHKGSVASGSGTDGETGMFYQVWLGWF